MATQRQRETREDHPLFIRFVNHLRKERSLAENPILVYTPYIRSLLTRQMLEAAERSRTTANLLFFASVLQAVSPQVSTYAPAIRQFIRAGTLDDVIGNYFRIRNDSHTCGQPD